MSGVIIRKDAGQVMPIDYIEKACAANQSFWGVAFPSTGKLSYDLAGEKPTPEIVDENQKAFQEYPVVLYLGSASKDYSPDIQQPFVLLGPVEDPLMVGFLDGDFKNYEDKANPKHTGEYICVQRYLKPKLEKLFRLCGNDLSKLVEEINADDFETDMDRTYGIHGTVVLLTATGECFEFAKNTNQQNYPWGWTSQNYGYTEEEPAKMEPTPAVRQSNLLKLKAAVAEKKTAPSNVVKLTQPTVDNGTNEPPPGRDASTCVLLKPPKNITKSKNRKRWYKSFGGFVPNNWQQCPAVWVLKEDAVKAGSGRLDNPATSFQDAKLAAALDNSSNAALHPDASTVAENDDDDEDDEADATGTKSVDVDHEAIEAAADAAITTPLHEKLPVIDPQELISFKGWYKSKEYDSLKALHQQQIGDPTKFAELESKIPNFVTALGMVGPEEVLQWTPAMHYYIILNWPTIGHSISAHFIKLYAELLKKDDRPAAQAILPTATAPTTVPATGRRRLLANKGAQLLG
jgi:hypothetical protein